MLESLTHPIHYKSSRFFLFVVGLVLLFGLMSYWSGLPTAVSFPFFLVGTAVFLAVFSLFAYLLWHLILRPLPVNHAIARANPLTANQQYIIALLFGLAILLIQIGGIWDEAWHRQYGVAFGDDLFWRPHQLIYAGFFTYIIVGFWGLFQIIKRGSGTLQQRFRANPLLGGVALLGGFLLYALPADPIWHIVYGKDITAWSMPHLILLFNMMVTLYLAVGFFTAVFPQAPWRTLRFNRTTLFIIIVSGIGLMGVLQIFTTEWDALFTGRTSPELLPYWNRPDWMLPVIIMAICASLGVFVIRATRMAGAATATTLVTLGVRLGMIELLQFDLLRAYPLYLMLGPMLLLDGWYALQVGRYGQPRFSNYFDGMIVFIGGWLFALPLIGQFYTYPVVNGRLLTTVLLIGLPLTVVCGIVGGTLAESVQRGTKQNASLAGAKLRQTNRLSPVLLVSVIGLLLVFILTANPPV